MLLSTGRLYGSVGGGTPGGHRYWRILITACEALATEIDTGFLQIYEIEMRETISGADVTGSGTAAADTTSGGNVAANAFDNNTATGWHSDSTGYPHWISYDFGANNGKLIVEIALTSRGTAPELSPRDFSLQWSDDNAAWTTSWTIHGEDQWTATQTRVYSDPLAAALYVYPGITDAHDILGSNLRAWYPSDLITGSNGDVQPRLQDFSGQGMFGRQVTAAMQPTLVTADLNGLNTLRYTGADSEYFALPNALLTGATAAMGCLVIKINADPPATAAVSGIWRIGGASGSSGSSHFPFTDSSIYDDFASTVRKTVGNPTPSLASTYRIVVFRSGAGLFNVRIDGTSFFSTGTNTFGLSPKPTLGRSVRIDNGGRFFLNGWIAEAIFADVTTSYEEIEGYVAHKWFGAGASNNLPGGHTYKTSPP